MSTWWYPKVIQHDSLQYIYLWENDDELPRFGAYTLWHNPRSDQALISKGVGLDVICSHGLAKMDRFEHFLQKDPEGAYGLSLSGILSRILKFGRQWNGQLWQRWRTHEKTVSKCCIARSSMTIRYNMIQPVSAALHRFIHHRHNVVFAPDLLWGMLFIASAALPGGRQLQHHLCLACAGLLWAPDVKQHTLGLSWVSGYGLQPEDPEVVHTFCLARS